MKCMICATVEGREFRIAFQTKYHHDNQALLDK